MSFTSGAINTRLDFCVVLKHCNFAKRSTRAREDGEKVHNVILYIHIHNWPLQPFKQDY